tara:strand:- start:39 stop:206 length:168 start_codon:yes stop_codon:yes gene_type:complete
MPSYGEIQKAAGVKVNSAKSILQKRSMVSRDKNIATGLTIDNVPYKGNAALNANK